MALRFCVKHWKAICTIRLLNNLLPHAGDTLACWGPWNIRSGKLWTVYRACEERSSIKEVLLLNDLTGGLRLWTQGKAEKQTPHTFHHLPKFPQAPWSSLTENGWPPSRWGGYTPSLSRGTKSIRLSERDQVAHLGRRHTWADRPPHPSCTRQLWCSRSLLLTAKVSGIGALWQLWEQEEPPCSRVTGSLTNLKQSLAFLWKVPMLAASNT